MFYVFLDFYTHKNKSIKVKSNAKTTKIIHINKCMIMKHLMHKRVLQRLKELDQRPKEQKLNHRNLSHPNGMIVRNECLIRSETKVRRMRTGDAHR